MKKIWRALAVLAVLWTSAAAFAGWRLNRWAGRDAMSVGVIGAADGPTSVLVSNGRWQSAANAFFSLATFFAGAFSYLGNEWQVIRKKWKTSGKRGS
ncbi:hypothetical protein [Faecalispora anaeroviscerum]|uniref:hypothetical protein n=1 Tax=Faecalispora anaeroviscerum TaxID=2991836 RepID=UPI0024BAD6E8|nr:hypothetical protein [Faecalispora anaeroviscerum]